MTATLDALRVTTDPTANRGTLRAAGIVAVLAAVRALCPCGEEVRSGAVLVRGACAEEVDLSEALEVLGLEPPAAELEQRLERYRGTYTRTRPDLDDATRETFARAAAREAWLLDTADELLRLARERDDEDLRPAYRERADDELAALVHALAGVAHPAPGPAPA